MRLIFYSHPYDHFSYDYWSIRLTRSSSQWVLTSNLLHVLFKSSMVFRT